MRRTFWALLTTLPLMTAGCAHAPMPGDAEVPPIPHFRPGLYVDVNPRWSHDGRRIAFLRATPDRNLQLYVADAALYRPLALLEGEVVDPDRPYHAGQARYASPDTLAWSPDDLRIAFARIEWFTFENGERLPGTGLWELNMSSWRVTPLALHPEEYSESYYYYRDPQWSPDGRFLAFVGEGINGERTILVHPLAGQKPQEVPAHFDNYQDSDWPVWEPGVRSSARAANTPEARNAPALVYRQSLRRSPAVSSTETLRRLHPGSMAQTGTGEFWRMTAERFAHDLPRKPAGGVVPRIGHPAWSPDGQTLAFTLTADANDFAHYELWIVDRSGKRARRVSPKEGNGYLAPVWLDNRRLGALSPHGDRFDVVTIDTVSQSTRRLGTIGSADCDWSPDRRRIVYAEPPTDAPPDPRRPTTLRLFETGIDRLAFLPVLSPKKGVEGRDLATP